jgi:hypothetical protein
VDTNPLAVQPTAALLELDYCNMDFFGEKLSFDSSRDGDRGTPLRRRHSLDLSSPNDGNLNYKRFKQSHSLPHEYGHLNAPLASFGSNASDLTPIPIGVGTPKVQNDAIPMKLNSSPMPLALPPKIGVSQIFQSPQRLFLDPKPSGTKRHFNNTISYSDVKRTKLTLPPQLVPDDKEGRRLVVINGTSKQCKDTKIDGTYVKSVIKPDNAVMLSKKPTTNAHFIFLKNLYPALEGCTFLLPGFKLRISEKKPFNIPGMHIQVSSFGSFKLGHDIPEEVSALVFC